MKLKNILLTSAIAVIGLASVPQSAQAANNYSVGDILLGFRLVKATDLTTITECVLDLGNYSHFVDGSFTARNISSDLSSLDSSWKTDTNIAWSAIGTTATSTTDMIGTALVFASQDPTAVLWKNSAVYHKAAFFTNVSTFNGTALDANQGYVAAPGTNSWDSQENQAASFGYFSQGRFESNSGIASVLPGSTLQLDKLVTNLNNTSTSTKLGTFSVDSNGLLSYAAVSVPEPSTYAMMAVGGLGILGMIRRRSNKA